MWVRSLRGRQGRQATVWHRAVARADWLPDGYRVACNLALIRAPYQTSAQPLTRRCAACAASVREAGLTAAVR